MVEKWRKVQIHLTSNVVLSGFIFLHVIFKTNSLPFIVHVGCVVPQVPPAWHVIVVTLEMVYPVLHTYVATVLYVSGPASFLTPSLITGAVPQSERGYHALIGWYSVSIGWDSILIGWYCVLIGWNCVSIGWDSLLIVLHVHVIRWYSVLNEWYSALFDYTSSVLIG